jgi:hypothetical protein
MTAPAAGRSIIWPYMLASMGLGGPTVVGSRPDLLSGIEESYTSAVPA